MSGECVQLQMVTQQRVQPIEAPPHVTPVQAQIHPHAGRQAFCAERSGSSPH
ncbi:MAG TPA: hypothetical protein VH325_11215 [Bryobacteraceae bacterium]|jgi:hypothetical protein|nr:hypothetical protein [Bryobacteraceae bacterium]